jgi:pSer/pThr/pTyr-binding forkhead associated (FHA) protein
LNDIYLVETPRDGVVHISRQHCTIDRLGNGFLLLDRNSMCGTGIVRSQLPLDANEPFVHRIGAGTPTDRALIYDGDLVIVGNEDSPYVFRFEFETPAPAH